MRRYEIHGAGLGALRLAPAADVSPGPGEVLVAMRAASLGLHDLIVLEGGTGLPVTAGRVPLSDGVGEVIEVGRGVSLRRGQRVVCTRLDRWIEGPCTEDAWRSERGSAIDGVLSEQVLFDEHALVPVPSAMDDVTACTLPSSGVLAFHGLVVRARIRAGETVLVRGTGATALFAIQFARALGAHVFGLTRTEAKAICLGRLGAEPIVCGTAAFDDRVRQATAGRGVDHVIETGGGFALARALRCLAGGGRITLLGAPASASPGDLRALSFANATLTGVSAGSREHLAGAIGFCLEREIRPVVDGTFPFEQAPAAYRRLGSGAAFGKVVVSFP